MAARQTICLPCVQVTCGTAAHSAQAHTLSTALPAGSGQPAERSLGVIYVADQRASSSCHGHLSGNALTMGQSRFDCCLLPAGSGQPAEAQLGRDLPGRPARQQQRPAHPAASHLPGSQAAWQQACPFLTAYRSQQPSYAALACTSDTCWRCWEERQAPGLRQHALLQSTISRQQLNSVRVAAGRHRKWTICSQRGHVRAPCELTAQDPCDALQLQTRMHPRLRSCQHMGSRLQGVCSCSSSAENVQGSSSMQVKQALSRRSAVRDKPCLHTSSAGAMLSATLDWELSG